MTLTAHPVGHVVELREGSRLVATVPQPDDADAIVAAWDVRADIVAFLRGRAALVRHDHDGSADGRREAILAAETLLYAADALERRADQEAT